MAQLCMESALIFALFFSIHVVVCRWTRGRRFVAIAALVLAGVLILTAPWTLQHGLGPALFVTWLTSSAWMFYVFVLICAQNSVSLRMMREIERAPGQALTVTELARCYSEEESVRSRLATMCLNRMVMIDQAGMVQLNPRLNAATGMILRLKCVFFPGENS